MNGSRYSGDAANELVDFRNNVIYNWGGNSGYAGMGGSYNFVNNYYKAGPSTSNKDRIFQPYGDDGKYEQAKGVWGVFYVDGNHMTASTSVTANNWFGIDPNEGNCPLPSGGVTAIKSESEFEVPHVTTQSAEDAYELVLQYCGANLNRDETDARVINEIRNGLAPNRASNGTTRLGLIDTQSDVGGWEDYTYSEADVPVDTDRDGMPDDWETAHDLNPSDATDRNLTNDEGYTNLEVYLNSLVATSIFVSNKPEASIAIKNFIVYPSRDKSTVTVQFENNSNQASVITMYDIMGRNVYQQNVNAQNTNLQKIQINTNEFKHGIYFVSLSTGNSKQTQKIILN